MGIGQRIIRVTAAVFFAAQSVIVADTEDVVIREEIQQLYSADRDAAKQSEQELIAQRTALARELIEGIKKYQKELRKIDDPLRAQGVLRGTDASINILGEMRSVEAIPILTEMIGFPQLIPEDLPKGVRGTWAFYAGALITSMRVIQTWDDDIAQYSAAKALVKIGEPCIPAVIDQLMGYQTVHPCLLVLVGLRGVEGTDALLTQRLQEATDEKVKQRYAITLEYLRRGMLRTQRADRSMETKSGTISTLSQQAEQFLREQDELADKLIQIAQERERPAEERRSAIFILGKIGSARCVEFLVNNIGEKIEITHNYGDGGNLRRYPCMGALVQNANANWRAVPLVLERIAQANEPMNRETVHLYNVLSAKRSFLMARALVEGKMEETKDPHAKTNLAKMLDLLSEDK